MIPFLYARPVGVFGIASMTKLFFLASFVHGLRTWRRMIRPELEDNSMFEGPALPFFALLPKGDSFWVVRILYEPIFVYGLSAVLTNLEIIQFPLMRYLKVAAFLLALKQFVAWHRFWSITRNLMDMASAGPIIGRIVDNKASADDMARPHLATLPKNLPPEIRKAAVAHPARAYPAEQEPRQDDPQNPEAGSSQLKFIFLMLVVAAFICLAMCGVTLRRTVAKLAHRATTRQQSIAALPSPLRGNGATEIPNAAQVAAFRSLTYLDGAWAGGGISREQACNLKFEMRPRPDAKFAGYATLTCLPLLQPRTPSQIAIVLQRSPRSAILTGIPGNGEVAFHVEKLIGFGEECPMSSLTVLPFGATQLAAEWKNGACGAGGQMVLTRASQ
jgi:hypothetical protein